jgi:MYXO-CTERM domain-containing protein
MEFQMRNKTFISSMVGVAAAAAVAGSVNAAIVDPFTQASDVNVTSNLFTTQVSESQSGSWLGGLFNTRRNQAVRGYGSSNPATARSQIGAGSWVGSFTGGPNNAGASVNLLYTNANGSAVAMNFDKVTMDVSFAGTTRSAGSFLEVYFVGTDEFALAGNVQYLTGAQLNASSLSFEFSKSQFTDYGIDWNQVTAMGVIMKATGDSGAGQTWTATNFQMTAVPAPGAIALLGVAGLAARRRRA